MNNAQKARINHFHLFCGLGGGAAGFNRGHARVGSMEAEFSCVSGEKSHRTLTFINTLL